MKISLDQIASPQSESLDVLCGHLAAMAEETDTREAWPSSQLRECAQFGVYRWFLTEANGGFGWDEAELMRGYVRLSAACLTTTFAITQATGAIRRIAASAGQSVRDELLPALLSGEQFTTLGISHLTTSRRHLGRPALRAEETQEGFRLDGISPWVTGAVHADCVVMGAQLEDERQILAIVPTDLPGVHVDEPVKLVALTASCTGAVRLEDVRLDRRWLLAGPAHDVMQGATGAKTGGLQTSALAIGLADRAIELLERESEKRAELLDAAEGLRRDHLAFQESLLALASGEAVCTGEQLRAAANSLALRAAQAALAAAKGSGYVQGHPAGRWCREALFFLVWSCPQPVLSANLCELAGISD